MKLAELKTLLGIPSGDTSNDSILSLYLGAALEEAQRFANLYDWVTYNENTDPNKTLPNMMKLGLLSYVKTMQHLDENRGVQSESMAGMSQTFLNASNSEVFADAYKYWGGFHQNTLVARPALRNRADATRGIAIYDENIQDVRVLTGKAVKL